ncbi:hypothetical protein D3C81_1351610 [compost metagenome]
MLLQHLAHFLHDPAMNISSGAEPERIHLAAGGFHVHRFMLAVHFLDLPHLPGQREAIAGRRHGGDAADFLGAVVDDMLLIVLKDGIEAEVVHDLLPAKSDDQRTFFGLLDVVGLQQILQHPFVLLWLDAAKRRQRQHGPGQIGRFRFTDALQRAHRLMV